MVYRKFMNFVLENGIFVKVFYSPLSEKHVYQYKDYVILFDMMPFSDEDLIVTVLKKTPYGVQIVYVSPSVIKGVKRSNKTIFNINEDLSDKSILEKLLESWENEI